MIFFMSDIHLGVKLPNKDFMESLEYAFQIIQNHEEACECIMICGDLFDRLLNVDELMFASKFIMKLAFNNLGRDHIKHVPVHIIEGTFSHDRGQMKIFEQLLSKIPSVSVSYFKTWTKVILPSGKTALYLPQEYGDVDYTEAFKGSYDLIIGHGPISSKTTTVVTSHGTEIMHSVEMLSNISKLCVFGHYHEYTDFGNDVYYTGSMLRFRYGEDTDKVFFLCRDDMTVEVIKNPIAREFKTFEIHNPEELRGMLSNEIDTPHRFVIHPKTDGELQTYHAIMNTTKVNQNIKFKVVSSEEPIVEELVQQETHDVDKSSSIEDPVPSLIAYINDKYDMDVAEEIHEYESKIQKEDR